MRSIWAPLLLPSLAQVARTSPLQSPLPNYDDDSTPLPLIIWHGLGDNFQNDGLRSTGDLATEVNPGTFVYYIHLGDDGSTDQRATFFGNVTSQIDAICAGLASHPILSSAPAVNALGFSQGGQFLRAYVQRCNDPPVANLVTFGSQHNGIAEFQACGDTDWLCKGARGILRGNTWSAYVQSHLVPAQYFRDPEELEDYLENSNFLADINNEREVKNETYRENLKRLERFVMYVFEEDKTVVPKESGWFSEFNLKSEKETKLRDRRMYKEDWLGLKYLDERGRLVFRNATGEHMQLTDKDLKQAFKDYFSPPSKKSGPAGLWDEVKESLEL